MISARISIRGRRGEGTCSLYLNLPHNGLAVELRSDKFDGPLGALCEAHQFDLCAAS